MRRIQAVVLGWLLIASGCGGDSEATVDAAGSITADAAPVVDGAASVDSGPLVPLPGFGDIDGMCGVLDDELSSSMSSVVRGRIDFARDRYDDPAERPQLTDGGVTIVSSDNAGGSSVFSETFAFEILARCEFAQLTKIETQIVYDVEGSKTDILVSIDDRPIGVSVTRAVTFPFGNPYSAVAAANLLDSKLSGILESSANVSAADAWDKQILAVLAYDSQHADVLIDAWNSAAEELRADTILMVFETVGDDLFIYTDN